MKQCFQAQLTGQLEKDIGQNLLQRQICMIGKAGVKKSHFRLQGYGELLHFPSLPLKKVSHPMQGLDNGVIIKFDKMGKNLRG